MKKTMTTVVVGLALAGAMYAFGSVEAFADLVPGPGKGGK